MKQSLKNIHSSVSVKRLLFIFTVSLLCNGEAWSSSESYIAQVIANKSEKYSGEGTVYVSTSKTDNPNYDNPPQSQYAESTFRSQDRDFYLYAKANSGNNFLGWAQTSTGDAVSTASPYNVTVETASSKGEKNAKIYNYYAIFAKYPTATVNVGISSGGDTKGGSVSVSSSTSAGSATTLSQYVESASGGKKDFYLHATTKEHYVLVGWTTNASGSQADSGDNPYKVSLATGSGYDQDAQYNYYAIFKQLPWFGYKFEYKVEPENSGSVAITDYVTEIWGTSLYDQKMATTAKYTATANETWYFKGWSTVSGGTNIEPANPYQVTATNETPGATLTTTLYAQFIRCDNPTSIAFNDAEMTINVGGTTSASVTITPDKSSTYKLLRYSSADATIASVNAETGEITGVNVGTTTITVKAYNVDKTTEACYAEIKVNVMDKLATPVITIDPNSEDDYDTGIVTIEKGDDKSSGAYFIYTTDGQDPTDKVGERYNASNKPVLANGGTIKVRAFCDGWLYSDIASAQYDKQMTSTPAIAINLNSDNKFEVTFSCKDDDVTYYYTTDGTTPTYNKATGDATGSTKKYSGAFVPSEAECTISVIATHEGWRDSEVVAKEYVRASGIQDGVVYLNDYEDHTWTYYSGIGDMSTNPYSYPTRLYSPNPRNVKIIYDSNGGAVSIDESETKFIYYETLEQGSTSGQYPYTVISNPFSKRPTNQGFGGWKIVGGGEYISGKSDGDVLSLDETITFVNLPYQRVNCTSAKIELQATWTTATIKYATSGDITFTGGTYETNFVVMKSSSSSTLNLKSPCTVMAVEPDGSADYRSNTFSGTISPNNSTMSKIEFVNWQMSSGGGGSGGPGGPGGGGQSSSSFNASGNNVTIGRGLTTSSTTISSLNACNSSTANQIFKVESGNYTTFHNYSTTPEGVTKQYVIFGCDYDRAKNDNSKLNITSSMYISECKVASSDDVEVCRVYSKSGKFVSEESIGSGTAEQSYYFGFSGTEEYVGYRYLEIQGGIWHNIAGGMSTNHSASKLAVEYRMKGGTILGCMYGAAQFANAAGIRKFVFTGGTVNGWIAGGANGTNDSGGELNGSTFVYIGGRCQVTSNNSTTIINHAVGGNVFGAGCGNGYESEAGIVHNGTNVVLADEAYVERGVYGGGGFGYTTSTANLFITGGHCGGVKGGVATDGSSIDKNLQGGIFGGHCQNDNEDEYGAVNILMTGGTIEGGLFGGCNNYGFNSNVNMTIAGGQIGTKTNLAALACGGGYGNNTEISGNVTMKLGIDDLTDAEGNAISPYFYGNCYGGAALGSVTGNVSLTINKGGSYAEGNDEGGDIFCGGLGQSGNTSYGTVGGSLTTTINGTDAHPVGGKYSYNAVYGGCHYINQSKTPIVTVNDCDVSIKELYGGSKLATLSGTNITVYGGNRIGSVYGGSNAANINGSVNLKVLGGGIDRVFGGNNNSGTISGQINMQIDQQGSCDMDLGEVYGGGNKASSNSVAINIGCPGHIGQLYGGANEANITGNIVLDVHGGTYGAIYGGNNKSGTVSGSVTINASKNSTCDLEIDTIFGGGNLADLAQAANKVTVNVSGDETKVGHIYGGGNLASVYSTEVNVSGGQVSGNIFGGGKGSTGSTKTMILSGGTNVNITGGTLTNVFGGNDAGGTITGELKTTIDKSTALDITGEVYGGGNEASSAAGSLTINCADHIGTVYGGAKNANITGNIGLKIGSGTIDNVFGGNNLGGNISGTITINVQHAGCSVINIGNLYGAGNLADYTVPTGNTYGPIINLKTCGESTVDWANGGSHCLKVGTIFGAGKGASEGEYKGKGKVIGNPQINVNAGEIGSIYGGGNIADVDGSTYVNIIDESTADNQDIYVTGNVYGGGNNASVTGDTHVQIGPKR